MARVTSKCQVTVPKAVAEQYGIRPGDDIEWLPAGDVIRVVPLGKQAAAEDLKSRLHLFDQATERNRRRQLNRKAKRPRGRGWTREGLYGRGRSH